MNHEAMMGAVIGCLAVWLFVLSYQLGKGTWETNRMRQTSMHVVAVLLLILLVGFVA